jgi:hypothetical protein
MRIKSKFHRSLGDGNSKEERGRTFDARVNFNGKGENIYED